MLHHPLRIAGLALALGFSGSAQTPPPSPAEQALQEKLVMDDGKPTPGQAQASEPSAWRALGSLVLVLGIAGGGLYLLRRYGAKRLPGGGGTRLKVEETLALGERRFVAILRADDEHFLLALTPQGVTCLSRLHGNVPFEADLADAQAMAAPVPVRDFERLMQEGRS